MILRLRTILILITAAQSYAQPSFFYPIAIPLGPGNNITAIVGADFNGDGRGDFAVTFGQSALSVFLSNADGSFTREDLQITVGANVDPFLAVADINGDGKPDLVATGFIFLGNGDETFAPPKPFQAAGAVVAIADFNRDGLADLLEIDDLSRGFQVQLGRGDGTFSAPGPIYDFPHKDYGIFRNVTTADLNGDGFPDVIWTDPSGYVGPNVWLGNGDGTFRYLNTTYPSFQGNGVYFGKQALVAGDVNGDGKTDVIEQAFGAIIVLIGDGTGALSIGQIYPAPGPPYTFLSSDYQTGPLALADFEHNGKLDIASYFNILPGAGDGTFHPPIAFGQMFNTIKSEILNYSPMVAEDINGDGKPDLVGMGPTADSITVLINSSGTPVASASAYLAPTGARGLAPGALATLYGSGLTTMTASATTPPLPTILGSTSVELVDHAGNTFLVPLIYVSPDQINFQVPDSAALGDAIINVIGNGRPKGAHSTAILQVEAGFFTQNGEGTGPPVASAVSVAADGTQTQISPNPLSIPTGGQVYLSLYGTGLRHATSTTCTVGKTQVTPSYFGAQSPTSLTDQVNIAIPSNAPKGTIDITCNFAPAVFGANNNLSNTVTITVQ